MLFNYCGALFLVLVATHADFAQMFAVLLYCSPLYFVQRGHINTVRPIRAGVLSVVPKGQEEELRAAIRPGYITPSLFCSLLPPDSVQLLNVRITPEVTI